MNIDTCSLLVEVSVSVWSGRKLDKSVTDEVVQSKGAKAKSAARVTKNLLADRPELEKIQKHVSAARTYVYTHTMPWSDSGLRLLPSAEFFKFNDRMQTFESEFDELVKEFVEVYPTLITAQAMALGDMFNRDEYPSPESMKAKFRFATNYMPLPDSGDFRIDVGTQAQKELQEKLEKINEERVANAINDVKARLGEHLRRMSDRLTIDVNEESGEAKPRRFHASLIDGAYELCSLVRSLNVVMDTDLEAARAALEKSLRDATADDIRESPAIREAIKSDVDKVLETFRWDE